MEGTMSHWRAGRASDGWAVRLVMLLIARLLLESQRWALEKHEDNSELIVFDLLIIDSPGPVSSIILQA